MTRHGPYGHEGDHCVHTDTSPGTFICCQCERRSSGMPGDCRINVFPPNPCQPVGGRLRRWYRHRFGGA